MSLFAFCLFSLIGFAQETGFQHVCAHHNEQGVEDHFEIQTFTLKFSSQSEAQEVLNDILSHVGLRANYIIEPASVPNAAAVIRDQQRYILYNQRFIQSVKNDTRTNWSAVSILAHEIGHHLNGHTVQSGGNWHKMELESDEFSGFILRKMGASLTDAQAAMNLLASANGSMTHPGKSDRLLAIERGWNQADDMMGGQEEVSVGPETRQKPKKERPRKEKHERQKEKEREKDAAEEVVTISHPSFAKLKVSLTKNPNSRYYITKSNNFIVMKGDKIIPIGKFKRTKDMDHPFMIQFNGGGSLDLKITPNGELISGKGEVVGFVLKV